VSPSLQVSFWPSLSPHPALLYGTYGVYIAGGITYFKEKKIDALAKAEIYCKRIKDILREE